MPSSADRVHDEAREIVWDERSWHARLATETPSVVGDAPLLAATLLDQLTNLNKTHLAEADTTDGTAVTVNLETLLDPRTKRSDGPLYARNILVSELNGVAGALPEMFLALNWTGQLPADLRPDWVWAMIGDAGTTTTLHLDILWSAAWNLLLAGHKSWRFYPPHHRHSVARLPKGSPALRSTANTCNTPIEFDQHPGELVITPTGWAHSVRNVEHSVAITGNFINDTNVDRIIELSDASEDPETADILRAVARHFRQQ